MKTAVASLAILALSGAGGCASTSPKPAFDDVAQKVEARSGQRVRWNQAGDDDAKADAAVRNLLSRELRLDGAVQIALLRNRTLRATYEELSVSQADLVQAGLLKNPVFSASMTVAERDNIDPNVIFGVTQDFFDLLMLPARKTVAKSQLEATKYRVADAVLTLAADVRAAYFSMQGAQQIVSMRQLVAEAAQTSFDLTRRQSEAGNVSDLVLATEQALTAQTRLDLARAKADVMAARERMNALLGLWGADTGWTVPMRLPELPTHEPPLDQVESRAMAQRLELAALRQEAYTLGYALNLATSTRWTGVVNVGADVGRLRNGGTWAVGPTIAIEVPLFDQRRAAIARLEALRRQVLDRLEGRATEIRAEVRAVRARVVFQRQLVDEYRGLLVPLREKIVALSQQEYDAMLLGVYQLLLAKQAEVNAYREYIEAVRDYWLARSDLERAVGGRMPTMPEPTAATKEPVGAPDATPQDPPPMSGHDHSKMNMPMPPPK